MRQVKTVMKYPRLYHKYKDKTFDEMRNLLLYTGKLSILKLMHLDQAKNDLKRDLMKVSKTINNFDQTIFGNIISKLILLGDSCALNHNQSLNFSPNKVKIFSKTNSNAKRFSLKSGNFNNLSNFEFILTASNMNWSLNLESSMNTMNIATKR